MARQDALLRLHKTLVARRDELRKRLGGEYLKDLQARSGASLGDAADMAFDTDRDEVNSQLAMLESKELKQVEVSLQKLRQGTYGVCEGCSKKIPVQRLNALPFSSTCINCQREMEMYGTLEGRGGRADWEKVADNSFEEHKEVNLSDLEMDIPGQR
jgi:DnaK suppressor protein